MAENQDTKRNYGRFGRDPKKIFQPKIHFWALSRALSYGLTLVTALFIIKI